MTFFTSPETPRARSLALQAWPAGLLLPGWPLGGAQSFSGGTFSPARVPTDTQVVSGHGYVAATVDQDGTGWALSSAGALDQVKLSGSVASVQLPQASSLSGAHVYSGVAALLDTVWALEAGSGRLFSTSSANPTPSETAGFSGRSTALAAASGSLYALQPGGPALQVFNPTTGARTTLQVFNPTTGARTTLQVPIQNPTALGVSGAAVAVIGTQPQVYPVPAQAFLVSPSGDLAVVASPEQNAVALLSGTDPVWTETSSVSGLSGAANLAWTSDGGQVLVAGSAGLTVLQLAQGVLQVEQSFALQGATDIALTPDGSEALVCQPGQNAVSIFQVSVGLWSPVGSFMLPAASAVLALSSISGLALSGTSLVALIRTGSSWAPGATLNHFTWTPSGLLPVSSTQILTWGSGGGTGNLALVSPAGAVLASLSWSGSADAVQVLGSHVVILDLTSGLIRSASLLGGVLALQRSHAAPQGARMLGVSPQGVWIGTSTGLVQMMPTAPWTLAPVRSGVVAVWNGTWHTTVLGVAHEPVGLAFDPSGNLWGVTRQNDLYEFSLTSGLSVATQSVIPVKAGQSAGVPIGLSSLAWSAGHLWGATSTSGDLLELT